MTDWFHICANGNGRILYKPHMNIQLSRSFGVRSLAPAIGLFMETIKCRFETGIWGKTAVCFVNFVAYSTVNRQQPAAGVWQRFTVKTETLTKTWRCLGLCQPTRSCLSPILRVYLSACLSVRKQYANKSICKCSCIHVSSFVHWQICKFRPGCIHPQHATYDAEDCAQRRMSGKLCKTKHENIVPIDSMVGHNKCGL